VLKLGVEAIATINGLMTPTPIEFALGMPVAVATITAAAIATCNVTEFATVATVVAIEAVILTLALVGAAALASLPLRGVSTRGMTATRVIRVLRAILDLHLLLL
jgi:hypothetical protein